MVVIGGGIIGTSIAYHLAEAGWTRHGAARARSPDVRDHVARRRPDGHVRVDLADLDRAARVHQGPVLQLDQAETGQATGFRPIGLIEVAADQGRLEEYRRVSAFNRHCEVDVHEISAREVGELFPAARTDDILAAFYTPTDGRVNPVDVTMALAKGARMRGATLLEELPRSTS